jgi:hypothetical protein
MIAEKIIKKQFIETSQPATEFITLDSEYSSDCLDFRKRKMEIDDSTNMLPFSEPGFETISSIESDLLQLLKDRIGQKEINRNSERNRSRDLSKESKVTQKNNLVRRNALDESKIDLLLNEGKTLTQISKLLRFKYDKVRRYVKGNELGLNVQTQEEDDLPIKNENEIVRDQKIEEEIITGKPNVSRIKRRLDVMNLNISRQSISKSLKKRGYVWAKNLNVKNKRKERKEYSKDQLISNISILRTAFVKKIGGLFFVDEIKLNKNMVPCRSWRSKGSKQVHQIEKNPPTLTCIVACTESETVALQYFKQEITGLDYLYFISKLRRYAEMIGYKYFGVFHDNASWHCSIFLKNKQIFKYFIFNLKGFYDLNLIENSFSFIKSRFRDLVDKLKGMPSLEDIVEIFKEGNVGFKFEGYFRNLIRSMIRRLNESKKGFEDVTTRNSEEFTDLDELESNEVTICSYANNIWMRKRSGNNQIS